MATTYKDFTFDVGDEGKCEEVTGDAATMRSVANIILSKPGNYPLTPDLGVDIGKYMFDPLDDYTMETIRSAILAQVAKYVPDAEKVSIDVSKVSSNGNDYSIGIVASIAGSDTLGEAFLVTKSNNTITVYGREMPGMTNLKSK